MTSSTVDSSGKVTAAEGYTVLNAGQVSQRGAEVTEFTVPTAGSGPHRIASGSDGNLWFTENGRNAIGRLTPAGVFSEFPIPSPNAYLLLDSITMVAANATSLMGTSTVLAHAIDRKNRFPVGEIPQGSQPAGLVYLGLHRRARKQKAEWPHRARGT